MEPYWIPPIVVGVLFLIALLISVFGKPSRNTVFIPGHIDVLSAIRSWALFHGFQEINRGPVLQFMKRGGLASLRTIVDLSRTPDGGYRLDAYCPQNTLGHTRNLALTSNFYIGVVPRKKALRQFNELITSLGHPPLG